MGRQAIKVLTELQIVRGDTAQFVLNLEDDAGNNRDLTGNTYTLNINRERNPVDAAQQIMSLSGTIVGAATDGNVGFAPLVGDYSGIQDSEFVIPEGGIDALLQAHYDLVETQAVPVGDLTIGKGVVIIIQDIGK